MNIEQLSEQADELADKKIGQPGEHHPDWHTVRDEIFAALVRNEALEEAARECEEQGIHQGIIFEQATDYCAAAIRSKKSSPL